VPDENDNPTQLSISLERGAVPTISLVGDLDPATAPQLEACIEEALSDPDATRLVLDLAAVEFIDSSGLRVFVAAREQLRLRDGELVLRSPSATTERLLDITGLTEIIEIEQA
jgi:anti-sigma B factor antagonist